jgi:hypothetical protein
MEKTIIVNQIYYLLNLTRTINQITNRRNQTRLYGEILTIPVIHIACNNCGALTSHAVGALDMLPKEEVRNNGK